MAKLNKQILLRVTEQERESIQTDARVRHMSTNNYLRAVVLGFPVQEQLELTERIDSIEARLRKLEKK